MNLRQLEILRAIVRYNTTVATGRALGLSQPAISNALKAMEEQVGFALFQRVNNRIYPTAETKILLADAESIFEIHKRLESRIRDLRDNRAGQLRVVATPPLGYGVIAKSIHVMQIRRPRVRTFFDVKRYEEIIESIETHQAELGFIMGFAEQPGIRSEVMYEGEMICVMQATHPLTELDVITPRDLRRQAFIALEGGTKLGSALRESFEQAEEEFHFSVEVRYGLTACVLADAGVGVAVVDPLTASSAGRFSLVHRPFRPQISVSASVVWAENRSLTRLAHTFLNEVRAVIATQDP
ncbi:LysR family transcriptional regulator [Gluconacetobacter johannae DSM 13595]|uniref:LysR family transcriptional regulator n=1 Tax=Gluconacetobacter johannae TaxID=112140 RepID=A0A7W4P2N7_9PROT|nr:LysR family transcriptional regulator [Gluconacetobacter johannae]MBB2175212.1 LysR family transcriptional regulator [Gluconacetobacter johannae]GBQ80661.1 LysR family transcriptional regulator [Gluconacetobacter johannae DSM 13595]